MKSDNFHIKDLLKNNTDLTFLIGAGCSVDPPSSLPSGKDMMKYLVDYFCIDNKKETLLKFINIGSIRFEGLIESIHDAFDKELRIIDFYSQSNSPNMQHIYLAQQIKKGNYVLTTNFDHLIESALIDLKIPLESVIPVISKEDFIKFSEPDKLLINNKYPIYKIHGSPYNFISKKNTKSSLITTLRSLGQNKQGMNLFQIESFKKPILQKVSENRILVIMGYSGSDDFDIMPTLKLLNNLKMILWINHDNDAESLKQLEITKSNDNDEIIPKYLLNFLSELKEKNSDIIIYCINVNTSKLIKSTNGKGKESLKPKFDLNPIEWLKKQLPIEDNLIRYHITSDILMDYHLLKDAIECSEEMLDEAKNLENLSWMNVAITNLAYCRRLIGDFKDSLELYLIALEFAENVGDEKEIAVILQNIGEIHFRFRDFPKALIQMKKSLKLFNELGMRSKLPVVLSIISEIYSEQGDHKTALQINEEAMILAEESGDLYTKMKLIGTKGFILERMKKYDDALEALKKSLNLADQLCDAAVVASTYTNIAKIHMNKKDYLTAIELLHEAINIQEKLALFFDEANNLANLGLIHHILKNYSMARNYYNQSLQIYHKIGLSDSEEANKLKEFLDRTKNL